MVKLQFKLILLPLLFIIMASITSCEEKNEPLPPIKASFTYSSTGRFFLCEIGGHIEINDFAIEKSVPSSGVSIVRVDYFLGGKLIKSCKQAPYDLDYEVPEMVPGDYTFEMDIELSAKGYTNTVSKLSHTIKIIEKFEE